MNGDSPPLEHFWLPFTANRDFMADPRILAKGEGVYLWDRQGRRILDGSSGLFCCAAGHARPEIAAAVARQLEELAYAPPFQFGNPLAFEFASRLAAITPGDLDHLFFTSSGSEAVDTAIKIAYAYHHARGEPQRQRFVSRERAYHGVNMGGVSLGGMVKNREVFGLGLPGVIHMRHTWLEENRFVKGQPEEGAELADDLERAVQNYGASTIAACFVEPIAGSTGCLVPPRGYLERLREICDRHGILLVFDEVITGFGRTGGPFAADCFGVTPDMMTLAKALTNAAIPMGAVAVSRQVHDTILDAAPDHAIELFHGYTYSGHPAACAAGLAALEIYGKERLFERAAELSGHFLRSVFALANIGIITDIRGYGLLAGFDLAPLEQPGRRGQAVQKALFRAGLYIKMTGDTGLIAPPFVTTPGEIDKLCAILREVLESEPG